MGSEPTACLAPGGGCSPEFPTITTPSVIEAEVRLAGGQGEQRLAISIQSAPTRGAASSFDVLPAEFTITDSAVVKVEFPQPDPTRYYLIVIQNRGPAAVVGLGAEFYIVK